jgi:hypothetical protein
VKEDFVRSKTKTLVFGALLAGALVTSAVPVLAQDYWHWDERNHRWERRADLRSDQRDLAEAMRQLEYDRSHRASRRRIDRDEARVKDIQIDIMDKPNDNRGNWD